MLLTRCVVGQDPRGSARVHAPRFPKPKDEGWVLVLGEPAAGELLALKRVPMSRARATAALAFHTPPAPGRRTFVLYVMSDSYLGLDQQYSLLLEVAPASLSAQVSAELELQ